MKKIYAILLTALLLVALVGCTYPINSNTSITTLKPTVTPSPTGTTVPTTIPTKPSATVPTVHEHPEPGKNEDDLTFTPEDVPTVYWNALNNRQTIYFPYGCNGKETHSGPCYAWLDDHRFPYLFNEIATSDNVWYSVVDKS